MARRLNTTSFWRTLLTRDRRVSFSEEDNFSRDYWPIWKRNLSARVGPTDLYSAEANNCALWCASHMSFQRTKCEIQNVSLSYFFSVPIDQIQCIVHIVAGWAWLTSNFVTSGPDRAPGTGSSRNLVYTITYVFLIASTFDLNIYLCTWCIRFIILFWKDRCWSSLWFAQYVCSQFQLFS